ncbi:HSP20 family protein [Prauserella shujinwangii]|uniref:HSP20 family protein n=1 Tax=Prauserella shujinwangii TaxID=1453103 RepID=A0A2T0LSG8_9PSEU|nr:Hsp20/alpha crystallin family protein [Prauserella shujinwangii]PRX46606.1 HSP20 family protein [Prauserella shujinwangii]
MALPAVRSPREVGRGDPFREFEDLYGQLGRWMNSMFAGLDDGWRSWSPLADVTETDDAYVVDVELPGVKRDDVSIELTGTELTIHGERKERERQGWFRHRTRRTGQFHYSVTLPHDVDADHVDARLEDGVLTVRVPKTESARPRRIAISGR